MKYYIIKPVSHKVDLEIIKGVNKIHKDAVEVKNLHEADEAILQKGWARSKNAIAEYHLAQGRHIPCTEGYLYRDKFEVKVN